MIRIELLRKNGQLVKSFDFDGAEFKIGRSLDCQLIVPDFAIELVALTILQEDNGSYIYSFKDVKQSITQENKIDLGPYRLILTNLNYFADASRKAPASEVSDLKSSLIIFAYLLLFSTVSTLIFSKTDIVRRDFDFIIKFLSIYMVIGTPLILISKLINHEFNFWKILKYIGMALVIDVFLDMGPFSLRWYPGRIFENDDFYTFFEVIVFLPILWLTIQTVFQGLDKKIRLVFFVLPLLFFLGQELIVTFPYQNKYNYHSVEPRPPVFQFIENRIITVQDLNKKIENEIN